MNSNIESRPSGTIFQRFSAFLKALYIFFPGILFLLTGLIIFIGLGQGKDIIYQSIDAKRSWLTGSYLVLACIFYVFTTWYTARIIAYNRNDLYQQSPWVLYHFPRLISYCIFLVLWLAVYLIDSDEKHVRKYPWIITIADIGIYIFAHNNFERILNNEDWLRRKKQILLIIRNIVRIVILCTCFLVIYFWGQKKIIVLLWTLPVFQIGLLFLIIGRHPLRDTRKDDDRLKPSLWNRYLRFIYPETIKGFKIWLEEPVFLIYHAFALVAIVVYILSITCLPFARELSCFPFVLLAFGILLGIINMLAFLSSRKKTNFNFLLIAVVVICGFIFETHRARLIDKAGSAKKSYAERTDFRKYLGNWIRWHRQELDSITNDSVKFPVFFTLADGGASRSGYWTASVLATLHENTRYDQKQSYRSYFSDHLFCLSGASGGGVGNSVFLTSLALQQANPLLRTDSLCTGYLGNDFLIYPLARLLGPDLVKPLFGFISSWGDRGAALEIGMEHPADDKGEMAKMMRGSFGTLIPDEKNHFPVLSMNVTRVNDGGPAVLSTIAIDSSAIFGKRIDVLRLLDADKDMRLSTAMVLGARFPYISPASKVGNSDYFVDGGYFDNSGAGVVHEMLLELARIAKNPSDSFYKDVNKLQYYVIHLSNTPYTPTTIRESKKIHPVINDIAAPLLTLAGSYNSQTNVNDARLINYLKEINSKTESYIIFNLYKKEIPNESISMNWVISQKARDTMDIRKSPGQKPELYELIRRMNRGTLTNDLFYKLEIDN